MFEDEIEELTFSDILVDVYLLEQKVETLDEDTLISDITEICYLIEGKDSERIQQLIFKNHGGMDLEDNEYQFLKNVYITYFTHYAILVDEKQDDEETAQ